MRLFLLFLSLLYANAQYAIPNEQDEKGKSFWMNSMKTDIQKALNKRENTKVAKNVIMFIGDGMGITVSSAGRVYKGQKMKYSGEETVLSWENFPDVALLKTYNLDKQVPDSAATATAFFGGVKANYYTLGVTGAVDVDNCQASLVEENRVSSVLEWARQAGKDTGIVTTTRVTHATPAALYSHSAQRYWECDTKLLQPATPGGCKDIAQQLVEDYPGKDINVIFAGGRNPMGAELPSDNFTSCLRNDSRRLVDEWIKDKEQRGLTSKYVTNTKEFEEINPETLDHIIGLFDAGHMPYELDRNKEQDGTPSIRQLTETALKRLERSNTGYLLVVEGGRIDHALHDTKAKYALEELVAFDDAIEGALELIGDDEETLIIVTADHSHVMALNGYPQRGNDILGLVDNNDTVDGLPYPTLMFTNGQNFNFTVENGQVARYNLTGVDTTSNDFVSPALVHVADGAETHGGEDVAVFAKGPMAHLFQKVHEQTYVAHVVGYAACIGPYTNDCQRPDQGEGHDGSDNSASSQYSINILFTFLSTILLRFR